MMSMKKRVVIVANGNKYPGIIKEIRRGDVIIGVDRAAYWLITHRVIPDVAIGDFDSVNEKERSVIQKKVKIFKQYSAQKDFTDTELALLYAVKQKPLSIVIFGASGTRVDHTLGTLQLLTRCQKLGIPAVFRDQTNEVMIVGRGRTILEKREGYRYISVIPVSDSISVSLVGFKYNSIRKTIRRGQTIGISNEFAGRQAEIIFHRGIAFIIQSRD